RRWRRRRLLRQPFPREWEEILRSEVPWYRRLPEGPQERLRKLLTLFLHEKYFIPAHGMDITDPVRVVIAAGAVRLLLGLDESAYDHLTEIVVYPFDFQVPYAEGPTYGEALPFGTVVLSWPAVLRCTRDPRSHEDVVSHEFAHVLDGVDPEYDADAPERDAGRWSAAFQVHFEALRRGRRGYDRLLDDYGAESPAEFFAVATEAFFAKPLRLRSRLPDLYGELVRFYGQDPAALEEG
ncbi:MAG: zinc-dependent peptidase, partial [Deltaproteobacteria bacterium]|nr:zinc-dependent peptidase [Deltaproteobacteria bacterium]